MVLDQQDTRTTTPGNTISHINNHFLRDWIPLCELVWRLLIYFHPLSYSYEISRWNINGYTYLKKTIEKNEKNLNKKKLQPLPAPLK